MLSSRSIMNIRIWITIAVLLIATSSNVVVNGAKYKDCCNIHCQSSSTELETHKTCMVDCLNRFYTENDCSNDVCTDNCIAICPNYDNTCKTPPPKSCHTNCATARGDPHFITKDGTAYTYHGECDLVMAGSPSFDYGLGLAVHARTTIVNGWSLISNVAVRVGDDTFEVQNDGKHYMNGIEMAPLPAIMCGNYTVVYGTEVLASELVSDEGKVAREELRRKWYNIKLLDDQEIVISIYQGMIALDVHGTMDDTAGMLGTSGSPGLAGRSGHQYHRNHECDQMASDWQVRDTEPMLFHNARQPQYPNSCVVPSPEEVDRRRLRLRGTKYEFEKQAKNACYTLRHDVLGAVYEDVLNMCYEDVLLTGDLGIAYAYSF